jgi:hypothetical protein
MRYCISFWINELPKPVNRQTSMHWAQKAKYVKHWHALVGAAVSGKKPHAPLKRAYLTLVRYSSREPDFDGLVSSFKPVVDGLITCGVLEDDKVSNVGQPAYLWELSPPNKGKIFVRVEERVKEPTCITAVTTDGESNGTNNS